MEQPAKPAAALRNAAALAVEQTSLRSVAREIGMSPTGLKKFLNGTNPYAPTRRRLREWYAEQQAKARPALDPQLFADALQVLVHDLPSQQAALVREQAYACLEAGYGKPIPRVDPQPRETQVVADARLALPPSTRPAPVRSASNPARAGQLAGV